MARRTQNLSILVGFIGNDIEVRYTTGKEPRAVTNLRVATSEMHKRRGSEEYVSVTEWHNVVLFGSHAEFAGKYLGKGRQVYVQGPARTRKWERDGQDHYTTEIVAKVFEALDKREDEQDEKAAPAPAPTPAAVPTPAAAPASAPTPAGSEDDDDCIPF